jgi:hypothetical protein
MFRSGNILFHLGNMKSLIICVKLSIRIINFLLFLYICRNSNTARSAIDMDRLRRISRCLTQVYFISSPGHGSDPKLEGREWHLQIMHCLIATISLSVGSCGPALTDMRYQILTNVAKQECARSKSIITIWNWPQDSLESYIRVLDGVATGSLENYAWGRTVRGSL